MNAVPPVALFPLLPRSVSGLSCRVKARVTSCYLSVKPVIRPLRSKRRGWLVADYRNGVEDIDRQIVSLLCRDGRISFTELSRQTGLSVSATHQRVRRLERRGVIQGYAAMIDPAGAGLPLTAFISIKPFDPAAPDDAPERLAHLPAIEACHSVAGDENYILKVRVASPSALEDLLQQIRASAGVSTRTTIVLSTPYENRPPDLEHSGQVGTGPDSGDAEGPGMNGGRPDGPHPERAHPDGTHPGSAGAG